MGDEGAAAHSEMGLRRARLTMTENNPASCYFYPMNLERMTQLILQMMKTRPEKKLFGVHGFYAIQSGSDVIRENVRRFFQAGSIFGAGNILVHIV